MNVADRPTEATPLPSSGGSAAQTIAKVSPPSSLVRPSANLGESLQIPLLARVTATPLAEEKLSYVLRASTARGGRGG